MVTLIMGLGSFFSLTWNTVNLENIFFLFFHPNFFINAVGFEGGDMKLQLNHLIDTADQILTPDIYILVLVPSKLAKQFDI